MSSSRQSICSHTSVTRIFDSFDLQICDTCKQPSRLGWVYMCTEDHDGFLPNHEAAGFFAASNPSVLKRVEQPTDSPPLNTWVVKAIEDGHYTPEQVEMLKAQKANLQRTTSSMAIAPEESADDDDPLAQLLEKLKDNHITSPSDNNHDTEPAETEKKENPSIAIPLCRYRCCPSCRPMTRDRAWVSLNRVCNDDNYARGTPEWELQNRRVADLSVVQKLGLYGTEPPTYPSTPNKQVVSTPPSPTPAKSDTPPTPAKTTPRKSYEGVRRPSVGCRIPLKRTVHGSFTKGREGLVYFGSDTTTWNASHKNANPLDTQSEEPGPEPIDSEDPDPEGGVPITTEKGGNVADIIAQA